MNFDLQSDRLIKEDSFFGKDERDEVVAKLRARGWKVKTGSYMDWDMNMQDAASGMIYWYKASKEIIPLEGKR